MEVLPVVMHHEYATLCVTIRSVPTKGRRVILDYGLLLLDIFPSFPFRFAHIDFIRDLGGLIGREPSAENN